MSALPPKADIRPRDQDVCFGPKADIVRTDKLAFVTGNDALEKIVDDPSIEILITDINMPGLSGTELAQRVRSFRDQLHVILLSGRESDSHGYPLIRKPVLRSDLQRVVAETSGPD